MISMDTATQGKVFPSLLLIALASHFVYYLNAFNGTYPDCLPFVACAMLSLVFGYLVGSFIKPTDSIGRRFSTAHALDFVRLRHISYALLVMGLASHLYYYATHPVQSYAESYGSSQGMGFVTAFFIFWPLSVILNEFIISKSSTTKKFIVLNRLSLIVFCLMYFLVLMKRRQILFLLLSVVAIWGPKMKRSQKWLMYICGISVILLFSIFGKVRGFYDANGLASTISYAASHFSIDWVTLEGLEGKFISRTLDDVINYVGLYGQDPSILLGVAFILIPSALLGGSKPLAFPEWYTYHFYPADYLSGIGYAGSIIGELYLIGGIILVIVGYLCLGFICARVQRRGRHFDDAIGNLVYSIFIYSLLLLPRYDLASLLIDIVFTYAPLVFAIRLSLSSRHA